MNLDELSKKIRKLVITKKHKNELNCLCLPVDAYLMLKAKTSKFMSCNFYSPAPQLVKSYIVLHTRTAIEV